MTINMPSFLWPCLVELFGLNGKRAPKEKGWPGWRKYAHLAINIRYSGIFFTYEASLCLGIGLAFCLA
jgi:hypothetical protein